jgi:tetratricopeptide (TPR) repeat protein
MSSPTIKSVKKLASRSASRHTSTSSARKRVVGGKSSRLKPATKRSPAGKARAQKAPKTRATKPKPKARATSAKARQVKPSQTKKTLKVTRRVSKPPKKSASARLSRPVSRILPQREALQTPPPQPTHDEAAALRAFEGAHREFARGHFSEARLKFRALLDKYSAVSEVAARARTYLAVAEARLRTELALPRDADSLYDRGVIELNRGEYVAAQELFERALKREPEAAHIHYGLAATRSRLGAIDTALKSLRRAFDLQPNLRIRAQRDQDLNFLRSDPEFDVLVFATRE